MGEIRILNLEMREYIKTKNLTNGDHVGCEPLSYSQDLII
jgi:hypothetical protein